MTSPGASRARAALRLSEKKGVKGSNKAANDSPRTRGWRGTAGTECTLIGSESADLHCAHENTGHRFLVMPQIFPSLAKLCNIHVSMMRLCTRLTQTFIESISVPRNKVQVGGTQLPYVPRPHKLPQQDPASRPQILSWSKKQYSRPATSLQWGVNAPSKPASEWSEAWTATIKENAKHPDLKDETTVFLVNPGRFFLATCDVTSPRCTRRAFGLNAKEYYAICEPIKSPPPSREGTLIRRHGPVERTRGKYDSRTCQFGFGIVEV